jgi:hypothetical protein
VEAKPVTPSESLHLLVGFLKLFFKKLAQKKADEFFHGNRPRLYFLLKFRPKKALLSLVRSMLTVNQVGLDAVQ